MGDQDTGSDDEERGYLLARATAHRQLAERAGTADARLIHLRLGVLYEERAAAISRIDTNQS